MKKFCLFVMVAFFSAFFFSPQIVSAAGIEAAIGIWDQDPSGDIGYKGESLSIEDNLRYGKETRVFGRLKIDMPLLIPNIYLMATPMKFDGDGTKTGTFTFNDKTYVGNVPWSSTLRLDHYDIALYYGIPGIKTATAGVFNIEAGLNARIIDLKAQVKQPSTNTDESKSALLAVPMIYLGAQLKPIKILAFEGEVRGIVYGSNHYYDLIGRIKVKPLGPIFIAGGYRYEDFKIDHSDVKANIKIGGPFLEAGVEF